MKGFWRSLRQCVFLTGVAVILAGCSDEETVAPVVNGWYQPQAASSFYIVRPTDTIYSIAFAFGLDYRALVEANHLSPPYVLRPGQRLVMTHQPPSATSQNQNPVTTTAPLPQKTPPVQQQPLFEPVAEPVNPEPVRQPVRQPIEQAPPPLENNTPRVQVQQRQQQQQPKPRWVKPVEEPSHFVAKSGWQWPAKGRLLETYSNSPHGRPGIAIGGRLGEPVKAAASGTVVYSGDGIRGYGNLIIIKHNDTYLSAYAFNQRNLVAVGDRVQAGRVIARMGQNDAGRTLLYFEIRRNGVPVNPMPFLK